jgi:hypothetical protein
MVAVRERSQLWDEADGLLARILLGEFQLVNQLRSDLAELRYVSGEAKPHPMIPLSVTEEEGNPDHAGYAGEQCPDCGSMKMIRAGGILTCHHCGSESA